jgi:hypothetical protein
MYFLYVEPKANYTTGKHQQPDFGQLSWRYLHIHKPDCSEILAEGSNVGISSTGDTAG